ncbi:MAG: DNA polymerase III subunit gamma/tau [Candidatus Tokpelaia sp. JSC161]|jgi:DNA polymerase-3 subunit gamma/tau|nr:MAG: DNA polymerase III subunit gamma/tau [Candidatus Tokpelaia sp. JSC161]
METDIPEKTYYVLARKYRPKEFSDLIGQTPLVRTLKNAFESGRIAQAWMLTGVRGVGKTTTARILARALNYKTAIMDRPTIHFDRLGEHCEAIMNGSHVDVVEMDAASHTGIEDIREITEHVRYRPVSARYKIYIIDEVHMLSTQAFNGLLKTLEEPPSHVKFIFATTEIRKVPMTVLSRCQRFDLRLVASKVLIEHLKKISYAEGIKVQDEAIAIIARVSEGSVRDALSVLDQAIAYGRDEVEVETVSSMLGLADRTRIINLFEDIMGGAVGRALQGFKSLYEAGADPKMILSELAEFTHLVTRLYFTPDLGEDFSLVEEERRRGLAFAKKLSVMTLSQSWQILLKGIAEVEKSSRPFAAAEMLLIRLSHAADLPTLDEVIRNLEVTSSQEETASEKKITEFSDLILLAGEKGEFQLKFMLREYVRLISFESGRIDFTLTKDAPLNCSQKIFEFLYKCTGESWVMNVAEEGGGATVAEKERASRSALLCDAENDSDVAEIVSLFPGSKVVDVRFKDEKREK